MEIRGHRRHLQNRTDLGLRLLFEVLSVDSTQIVGSLVSDLLNWFVVLKSTGLLLEVVASISSGGVEPISIREIDLGWSLLVMGIGIFLHKLWAIGSRSIKRLSIRYKLVVFDEDIGLGDTFSPVLVEIFRCGVKRHIFILIFDPRNNLLPHLRFLPRVIFSILGVDIRVGDVGLCFWICEHQLSAGGFFQVLIGFFTYYFW